MTTFKNLTKSLLAFFISFTIINDTSGQCNPELNVIPANDCFTAAQAVFGNGNAFACDLVGLCLNSDDALPLPNPIPFCAANSVLNNPMWISFVADDSGFIDLIITNNVCTGGTQWALYDQCGNYFNTIACQSFPVIPPNTPFNIYSEVVPGNLYYLVIDGANGATCNYIFQSATGVANVSVGAPLDSVLSGDLTVCPEQTGHYNFAGFQFANNYTWTFDGIIKTSDLPEINFSMGGRPLGTYQLCVTATNGCDEIGQSMCWDIEVVDGNHIEESVYTCPGDSALYQGHLYAPGIYDSLPYSGPLICVSSVTLTVTERSVPIDIIYDVVICDGQQFFNYQGVNYMVDSLYEDVIFESNNRCPFPAGLIVSKNDAATLEILADRNSLPCISDDKATLSLEGNIISAHDLLDETYVWRDESGNILGTLRSIEVGKPGIYTLLVTSTFSNPKELIGLTDKIICTRDFSFIIENEDAPMVAPIIKSSVINPQLGKYMYEVENIGDYPLGTEFIWAIPPGVNFTDIDTGIITLDIVNEGTYTLCVQAFYPCGASEEVCIELMIQTGMNTSKNQLPEIKILTNPVGDFLSFNMSKVKNIPLNLHLIDLQGIIKYEGRHTNMERMVNVDVKSFTPGIYFYEFISKDGLRSTGKFIKL